MSSESSRKPRDALKSYYGLEDSEENSNNIYDLKGAEFSLNQYLKQLLKSSSLNQLIIKENEMVNKIQSLDNEMQTLVYENYNKFINATDTIRKMKNDFKEMEDGMDKLSTNMSSITELSLSISKTLQNSRHDITKLSNVHALLKKLQFLFELPSHLKKCVDDKNYRLAVRYYTGALKVLNQYSHMPSLAGIQKDCQQTVDQLIKELRTNLTSRDCNTKQLCESVELLLKLNQPSENLCEEYLLHAHLKLSADIEGLEIQLQMVETYTSAADDSAIPLDILAFVDLGCNGFISNLCLVVASYNDMFLNRLQEDKQLDAIAVKKLSDFVNDLIKRYFQCIQDRFRAEKNTGDNKILVRALDRFFRKLQVLNNLVIDSAFTKSANDIVIQVAKDRVNHYYEGLCKHFADCLTDIRQKLVSLRSLKQTNNEPPPTLASLLNVLHSSVIDHIKSILASLMVFLDHDLSFGQHRYFKDSFSVVEVREHLVIGFIRHIIKTGHDFTEASVEKATTPSLVILIMSRLLINLEQSTIRYLLTLLEEQFSLENRVSSSSANELCQEARSTAKVLINHYVKLQGATLSQMLRKSVETRDCLSCIEPRSVKAVMKRVVEDMVAMDVSVGELYEEGCKAERTSDSTKHSFGGSRHGTINRSQWSFTHKSNLDNSLLSNIQKLFSEKIDIFTPVTFSKVSVLTGIVKISLKTLLECVRLKTFGRYGLQQIQVDTYYLQLHLWRFVSDENIVHALLDEIMSSVFHRCIDPTPMESSVVDLICERS